MRTLQPSSENVDMLLAQASDTYVLDPEAIERSLGKAKRVIDRRPKD